MKHAYLILAHNQPKLLLSLVTQLDNENNDIYIHIDAKSSLCQFAEIESVCKYSACHILEERVPVFWGGYSIVKAERLLFAAAYSGGDYGYFHLLSGVDFPLKSNSYIQQFFEANKGLEFLGFDKIITEEHAQERVRYRYFFIDRKFPKWLNWLIPRLNGLSLRIQNLFKLYRSPSLEIKHGSQWCSLSREAVGFLLSKSKEIDYNFKLTLIPDELYKQTILWNSTFRENIYDKENNLASCLYEMEWGDSPGMHPYTFTLKDKERLLSSNRLFARKFSQADMEIIKELHSYIS